MRSKLYVETSVISYLTARPSRDVISLGHQQLTREWWDHAGGEFELYASRLVVAEAQLGDAVTWNCRHIANARMIRFVTQTCEAADYRVPVICTPEELGEE
jgi:hypothetical protein